jgi:hypothetical protein
MRLVGPLGLLAMLSAAPPAFATPSARLVYARSEDAASCPDEAALRKAVEARFGYDPFFAWAHQTVVAQISREDGRYVARVQLVDEQGLARGTRELRSDEDDCAEVFDAAALAISIALDASAATSPAAPAPAPPAPTTPDDVPAGPPVPGMGAPPAADANDAHAPPGPPSPTRLGVEALAGAFIGPNVAPGAAVFASYRRGNLSLGVDLDAEWSTPAGAKLSGSSPPTGRLASALFAASVLPCAHRGKVFACAVGQVGWLEAWGWGVAVGQSMGTPFVSLGARVGVEWPLGRRLFVRAHADGLANLELATLTLDGQNVWKVPAVGGAVGLGLGAPLP